ncbi:uncharacterized protein MONBRDRAFT_32323 [Monosiga brevicollis MX1]|uniref:Tudor domain-containing protein n=1 Tax=Monosiga brevicollis TaxID=81824 RepID=A9UYS7_MONBE|nr:uncharacterized protein MONBRDRAFT_32323 [Monosiga brevicollis MX1]EDQ89657.1 predicted protein [Monosiga brevicollis MX1]|eukprot:XP_001745686.1 hypothetical protein [Monosiga brevicollis MX1]
MAVLLNRMALVAVVLALLVAMVVAQAHEIGTVVELPANFTLGSFEVQVAKGVTVVGPHGTAWQSGLPVAELTLLNFSIDGRDGVFAENGKALDQAQALTLVNATLEHSCLNIVGWFDNATTATLSLCMTNLSDAQLHATLALGPTSRCQSYGAAGTGPVCQLALHTASQAHRKYHGFGEQYSVLDFKGRRVPIMVAEQGVGRGLEPLTYFLNTFHDGSGGNWATTYAPIPHYMTSDLQSVYFEDDLFMLVDLTQADITTSYHFASATSWYIMTASSPKGLVSEYARHLGRQPMLPEWSLSGPIIGFYGGTDRVLELYRNVTALGMNVTAFWLQDWTGERETVFGDRLWWNWVVDEEHYPNWDSMVHTLKANGTRVLTYINPYLAATRDPKSSSPFLFAEAAKLGFLVKNSTGDPYIDYSASKDFTFGTIDLTNPEAQTWYANIMQTNMLDRGHSGWMSDFGEYLLFDARLNQSTPAAVHNRFPELWSETNRLAITNQDGTLKDALFFSRSGFRQSPTYSTLFWMGDQLPTYDSCDGLQSMLIGRLNSGLSGFALSSSDIGGYTMVNVPVVKIRRSKELLLRWMETSAVTDMIFRSHQGNAPNASWQVYSDDATLRCFARAAALHDLFVPYRKALMASYQTDGLPLIRPLWLNFPDIAMDTGFNNNTGGACNAVPELQLMLGDDILFAPILEAQQTSRRVTFPTGIWVDIWSQRQYLGPQTTTLQLLGSDWDDSDLVNAYENAVTSFAEEEVDEQAEHGLSMSDLANAAGAAARRAGQWQVGDMCQARWSEDQEVYDAEIKRIDAARGECLVLYVAYGNSEVQRLLDLLPAGSVDTSFHYAEETENGVVTEPSASSTAAPAPPSQVASETARAPSTGAVEQNGVGTRLENGLPAGPNSGPLSGPEVLANMTMHWYNAGFYTAASQTLNGKLSPVRRSCVLREPEPEPDVRDPTTRFQHYQQQPWPLSAARTFSSSVVQTHHTTETSPSKKVAAWAITRHNRMGFVSSQAFGGQKT